MCNKPSCQDNILCETFHWRPVKLDIAGYEIPGMVRCYSMKVLNNNHIHDITSETSCSVFSTDGLQIIFRLWYF
jgi:hypothetical protein